MGGGDSAGLQPTDRNIPLFPSGWLVAVGDGIVGRKGPWQVPARPCLPSSDHSGHAEHHLTNTLSSFGLSGKTRSGHVELQHPGAEEAGFPPKFRGTKHGWRSAAVPFVPVNGTRSPALPACRAVCKEHRKSFVFRSPEVVGTSQLQVRSLVTLGSATEPWRILQSSLLDCQNKEVW